MSEVIERCCLWCFDKLIQRDSEKLYTFKKRNFCCKEHAGLYAGSQLRKLKKARIKRINDFTAPIQYQ